MLFSVCPRGRGGFGAYTKVGLVWEGLAAWAGVEFGERAEKVLDRGAIGSSVYISYTLYRLVAFKSSFARSQSLCRGLFRQRSDRELARIWIRS